MEARSKPWDVIVIGGGIAGLSAAIYLARGRRDVLVIDEGKSMARWEPDVQNYLGFPDGIAGTELLHRGREHAEHYGAKFCTDKVIEIRRAPSNVFHVVGEGSVHETKRVLVATGLYHLPPQVHGVEECLGHSMFFCKDCDGVRCEGKRIGIFGWNDEAAEYALGMVVYSPCVFIFLNGHEPRWSATHEQWLKDYEIPVYADAVSDIHHLDGEVQWLELGGDVRVELDALFTARGDVYHNKLARMLGAATNEQGEIAVNDKMETTVPGLYAAGCVTPANCQMIIAAGEGAIAAQAINRSLFEESLATRSLHRYRARQLQHAETEPPVEKV